MIDDAVKEFVNKYKGFKYVLDVENAGLALAKNTDAQSELATYLESIGIGNPLFLTNGSLAIILENGNGTVTRIVKEKAETMRFSNPEILQPLSNAVINGLRVEVMPKVPPMMADKSLSQDEKKELVQALKISLAKQGLNFFDDREANVGILCDGTPVIIDLGSVSDIKGYKMWPDKNRKKFEELTKKPEPKFEWNGKQEQHISKNVTVPTQVYKPSVEKVIKQSLRMVS